MEKIKITKKNFVRLLIKKFGGTKSLSEDDFTEMSGDMMIRTTLYYKGDEHVASWSGGEGWFV